jgi:hypothetical protein
MIPFSGMVESLHLQVLGSFYVPKEFNNHVVHLFWPWKEFFWQPGHGLVCFFDGGTWSEEVVSKLVLRSRCLKGATEHSVAHFQLEQ